MKKLFGLFVHHEEDETFISASTSNFLICVSSNFDKLDEYCKTLQKAAELLSSLLPSRGKSFYRVDEIQFVDL